METETFIGKRDSFFAKDFNQKALRIGHIFFFLLCSFFCPLRSGSVTSVHNSILEDKNNDCHCLCMISAATPAEKNIP